MFKINDIDRGPAPIIVPLAAALIALAIFMSPSQAQQSSTYVIPAGGYGVDECLSTASECGLIVANAWCEAHGHGPARAFGAASDVTFSTSVIAAKAPEKGAIVIKCND